MGANTDLVRGLRTEATLLVAKKKKSSVFDFVVTTDASCNQGAAVGCAHVLDVRDGKQKSYLFWHGPVSPMEPVACSRPGTQYEGTDCVSAELATITKALCRLPLGARVKVCSDQRFLAQREYENMSIGYEYQERPERAQFHMLLSLISALGMSVIWEWVTRKVPSQNTPEYKYCHNACKHYVRALTDYRGRASIPA